MIPLEISLAATEEVGSLGVCHLKRLWSSVMSELRGVLVDRSTEFLSDRLLLDALGVGLHQGLQYLYLESPSFERFEHWIIASSGAPGPVLIERINAALSSTPEEHEFDRLIKAVEASEPVLSAGDLAFWQDNGYVVLRDAVDPAARQAGESAIWEYQEGSPEARESWYQGTDHGIMLEFIQHPALQANRQSPRIHKAFAQLWDTADLWVSADRCSFHHPQREGHPFPGPDLHWDIDLGKTPVFGTQGLLYLTDTPAEQGALTLVPGFQHRLDAWLQSLGPGSDANQQDLHALGSIPVAARGGDMVIWHQSLPHGSRPNLGSKPRIVQYINMYPGCSTSAISS